MTGNDVVNEFEDLYKDAIKNRGNRVGSEALIDNLRRLKLPSNIEDLNKLVEAAHKRLQKDVSRKTYLNPWQPYLWLAMTLINHASDMANSDKTVEPLLKFCNTVVQSKDDSRTVYVPKKLGEALVRFAKKPLSATVRLGDQTVPTLDLIGLAALCIVESNFEDFAPDDWWHNLCEHVIVWILTQSQRAPAGEPAQQRRAMLETAIRYIQQFLSSCKPVGRKFDVFFASLTSALAVLWKGCVESVNLLAFAVEAFASQSTTNATTLERHLKTFSGMFGAIHSTFLRCFCSDATD